MILKRLSLIIILLAGFASIAFAVPPVSQYTPGEELDPNCEPGDTNCTVDIATHGVNGLSDIGAYQIGLGGEINQDDTFIDGDGISEANIQFGQIEPLGSFAITTSSAGGSSGDIDFEAENFSLYANSTISLTSSDSFSVTTNSVSDTGFNLSDTLAAGTGYVNTDETISGISGFSGISMGLLDGAISNYLFFANASAIGGVDNTTQIGFSDIPSGLTASTVYSSVGYVMTADTTAGAGGSYALKLDSNGLTINNGNSDSYTFPAIDGTNGQVLTTDGNGALTWETPAGVGGGAIYQLYIENPSTPTTPVATGDNAIAIGNGAQATGNDSVALGRGAIASGIYSLALPGFQSIASGDYSMGWGNHTNPQDGAQGYASLAFGDHAGAAGDNAFSMGYGVYATGDKSFAFGTGSQSLGERSFAFGSDLVAQSAYETVFGRHETDYVAVDAVSFNAADRLFVVGNGDVGPSDAFTILKNGDIGIGIDNFETNTNGNILQIGDGTTGIIAYVDSGTGAWVPVSDERMKNNIKNISYGLDTVLQLRPVSFDYKRNDNHTIGFIAQETKSIIPESVFGSEEAGYGMAYDRIVPVTVRAIQELNTKVDIVAAGSGIKTETMMQSIRGMIADAINSMQDLVINTLRVIDGYFENLTAKKATIDSVTTSQLCVGVTCLDESQVQSLMRLIGQDVVMPEPESEPSVSVDVSVTEQSGQDVSTPVQPEQDPVVPTVVESTVDTSVEQPAPAADEIAPDTQQDPSAQ